MEHVEKGKFSYSESCIPTAQGELELSRFSEHERARRHLRNLTLSEIQHALRSSVVFSSARAYVLSEACECVLVFVKWNSQWRDSHYL